MPGDKKELIQYLFDASNNDRNFEERFQSFLDQIPKPSGASAAPEKEGFFINFFAGMFASLGSTELAEKLKLGDLHFRIVQVVGKELHVIAEIGKEKKKHLFIFSESRDKNSNTNLKAEIKNVGKDLKSSVTKVLIGREILEGEDQKWKFEVLVEHKKGENPKTKYFKKVDCKADENLEGGIAKLAIGNLGGDLEAIPEIIEGAKKLYSDLKVKALVINQDKEAAQHGFISGMLMNFRYRYNLRLYLELLTGRGYSDIMLLVRGEVRSWLATPVIMELKAKGNVDNALEEAKIYARGLRRNKMRMLTNSDKAICMGINLNEPRDYYKISEVASEVKRNEEPIMQSLINIVYGNNQSEVKVGKVKELLGQLYYTFPPEQYTKDYLSRFLLGQLLLIDEVREKKVTAYVFDHHLEENIVGIVTRPLVGDINLTTFMFVVKESSSKNKVFVFHIQEGGSAESRYNNYSFTEEILGKIGLKHENIKQLTQVCIMGYKGSGPTQSASSPGSFYQNQGLVKIEDKNPKEYFEGTFPSQERQTRSTTPKNRFKGVVESIDLLPKLIPKFKKAIDYQQKELGKEFERLSRAKGNGKLGVYKDLFDMIKKLMYNKNGNPKETLVSMISSENRFKAFLDGLFTGLSDLDKDRVIAVLTEFQVGGGGRVDIMIQVVDNENPGGERNIEELKKSVSMGFELKYSETATGATEKLEETESQMGGYARSENIKSITEGDRVAFIGVVFNSKASQKDDLILVSEKFIVAGVEHSSTDVSRASVPSLQLEQVSDPQPGTSKVVGGYH